MSKISSLSTPLSEADVRNLNAGDIVKLTGVIYTGRDAAHKRLCAMLEMAKNFRSISMVN